MALPLEVEDPGSPFVAMGSHRPAPAAGDAQAALGRQPCMVELVSGQVTGQLEDLELAADAPLDSSGRRHDIDAMRTISVWLVLFYHTVLIYCPWIPFYVKDPRLTLTPSPSEVAYLKLLGFMNAWNMPFLFLLAGMSAYLSLNYRTHQDFIEERVHRLLSPPLFIYVLTQLLFLTSYSAPHSRECEMYFRHPSPKLAPLCPLVLKPYKGQTNFERIVSIYAIASPQQGWFCIYLLVYSLCTSWVLRRWHPRSGQHEPAPEDGGCQRCVLCGLTTPQRLLSAMEGLRGPARLALLPGLWLSAVEVLVRPLAPDGRFGFLSVSKDYANDLHFCSVFLLGFALAAADGRGFRELLHRCRWWYLIGGLALLVLYVWVPLNAGLGMWVLRGLLRGFGEWPFMLGSLGLGRAACGQGHPWLPLLRELSMPFYLLHMQLQVVILSASLWIPYLRSFPAAVVLGTLGSSAAAWLAARSGPLRYCFGLKPPRGSAVLAQQQMGCARRFLPLLVLTAVAAVLWLFGLISLIILIAQKKLRQHEPQPA